MKKKISLLVFVILILGMIYRIILTLGGNFLFNMDNARDMVDVREIVVLGKLRLTGPTSAIEGLYNGPAWYYLLAIPFIVTGGDPYGSIVGEIILWAIGGFFLLKLVSSYGKAAIIAVGSVWVASNYVVLTNLYAFNPNPVILLTPLFIYSLKRYLETDRLFFSLACGFLAGLFFNFEMNFGIFMPFIIIFSLILSRHHQMIRTKNFLFGLGAFVMMLLPQVLFDMRHQFIMTTSVLNYLDLQRASQVINPILRSSFMAQKFYDSILPTFMNFKLLTQTLVILFFFILFKYFKNAFWKKDLTILISLLFIFVPFFGYILIPTTVNSWHLGGVMAATILLLGFVLKKLFDSGFFGKLISVTLFLMVVLSSVLNIINFFTKDFGKVNLDPSSIKNEIAAIDYVYQKAEGQNFKVYTYLPSVYDYPYQYLFWWYGKKTYGYIPGEYAYSPNKPQYISNKDKFEGKKDNFSGLIFLIKEPDRIRYRTAWENDFKDMEFISKEMVGPLEIEIRRESTN